MGSRYTAAPLLAVVFLLQACNNDRDREDYDTAVKEPAPAVDTMRTGNPPPMGGVPADAAVALGEQIFHGKAAGGTCFSCHGQDAKGSPLGPDLTDKEWLNTEPTEAGIAMVIKNGVPKPQKFQAAMPPMGGAKLTEEQVQALAKYVFSLSD